MRVRVVLLLMLACGGLLVGACNNGGPDSDSGTPSESSTLSASSAPSSPSSPSGPPSSSAAPSDSTSLSPVPKVFDSAEMQSSVQQVLTESYRVEGVDSVTCPSGQQVVVDSRFDCSVIVAGETKHVTITVKSVDGKYEVGQLS